MDSQSRPDDMPLRPARQFSLRELLVLTLAVSFALTIGIVARGSRFEAFSSPWALAALAPVVGVLVIGRFQLASPRALAMGSIALYVASLCTPAIGLDIGSSSPIWGFHALYFSLWIFLELVFDFHGSWSVDQFWGPVVYLMFFIGARNPRAVTYCRRAALVGAVMAAAVMTAFLLEGGIKVIYPGYGLWVASFLAMALAAKRADCSPQRNDIMQEHASSPFR